MQRRSMLRLLLAAGYLPAYAQPERSQTESSIARSQPTQPDRSLEMHPHSTWGDQGDGTYSNPVLPADFSDLDVIRVGDQYYAISSTMQYAPGMIILRSPDLVNWTAISHVVQNLTLLDPDLSWRKMKRAGRGVWAGSIRYHNGRFWVYFGTPDQGIFLSTALNAAGPWSDPTPLIEESGWDDPCPFWDDDGQGYLVATRFAIDQTTGRNYNVHLFRLDGTAEHIVPGFDRIIHQSAGSEANKVYRIHGVYYHFFSQVMAEGRVPMMERARNLDGQWEIRQLMHVDASRDKEPNQGGLVQTPSRDWYFFTHQGHGDWEGRAAVLLPVTWIDGWPIPGRVGEDGIGNMIWSHAKPITGFPRTAPLASGAFHAPALPPAWEWRNQPRNSMKSLTVRPGSLRLYAFPPLRTHDFRTVGNVLTQRAFRTERSSFTVRLDLSGMVDGQQAGLAHLGRTFSTVSVTQMGPRRTLQYQENERAIAGPQVVGRTLYLRSVWNFSGESQYLYSLDGKRFQRIGPPYQLTWGSYRGDRVGLFTTNTQIAGFVDVESVDYDVQR